MPKGIIQLSFVPVYAEASVYSHIVSQFLFGETYEILETREDWLRVVGELDAHTTGWVFQASTHSLPVDFKRPTNLQFRFLLQGIQYFYRGQKQALVPFGAELSLMHSWEADNPIITETIDYHDFVSIFLGTPYLSGGRSVFGIDAVGLVQAYYRNLGELLPHNLEALQTLGTPIDYADAQPNDILFFCDKNGQINHTAILLPEKMVLHVDGFVKTDTIKATGIIGRYRQLTHQLVAIRTLRKDIQLD